jgi:hypothetical protein
MRLGLKDWIDPQPTSSCGSQGRLDKKLPNEPISALSSESLPGGGSVFERDSNHAGRKLVQINRSYSDLFGLNTRGGYTSLKAQSL